ncbi:MAG TPA: PEP-CTERM/exosortase system-associated acyltransferase [Dissulfurispiraceae bacterium]|nr:PEP-CTERM/exosortase system-associated acyltransferase [Dissulfurispiraceae bacterium]
MTETMYGSHKFCYRHAVTPVDLHRIYQLRYQVYVNEWHFERIVDHPGGIEKDVYDQHSLHFMAFSDNVLIGTVRIIRNSPIGFPHERHCTITTDLAGLNRQGMGEISRLAVSKEFRRRSYDKEIFEGGPSSEDIFLSDKEVRRKRHEIIIGLFKVMYRESKIVGLTHWIVVTAPALQILLRRLGICCEQIGPEVNYHGMRTPYLICITDVERHLAETNCELLQEFMEELPDSFKPNHLPSNKKIH